MFPLPSSTAYISRSHLLSTTLTNIVVRHHPVNMAEPTILIIGAGIFGSSTACHLAQRYNNPSRITVIDRGVSPPDPAASTDINKIIRADYSSSFYCDLAYEAMEAWQHWPELKDHYHRTGWIMLDNEGSDLAERIRKVFRGRGHDPTEDVPLGELGGRWGGVMKGTETEGFKDAYWNPEAGWCNAAAATAAVLDAAVRQGVRYLPSGVSELVVGDEKLTGVRTNDGRLLTADRIVLATGAWTSSLMSPVEDKLDIADADRVEKQATAAGVGVAHYHMTAEQMEQLASMPVVVYGDHGEVIPPPEENRYLKYTNANTFTNTITTKTGHKISVPPERDQHIVPKALQRETHETMISKVMPAFARGKEADYWRLCWDARTPTQDWLLSRHPDSRLGNLFLAVGGSFHSYKFLPTAGKYMANVLLSVSNGAEKDRAWSWKDASFSGRGAHEKTEPKRELRDLQEASAKL